MRRVFRLALFSAFLFCLPAGARSATTVPEAPFGSKCDVDGDGITLVTDVQAEIGQALGTAAAANDLNNDGVVNAVDVQFVVNAALGLGCAADTNPPAVSDFNPKTGPTGTLVTVTGTNLVTPQVIVLEAGGGLISPPLLAATATTVTFAMPAGAATGPITVSTATGNATTRSSFAVTPSTGFSLTVAPPSANLIQGQSAAFAISLAGTNGFNQLSRLSVTGVPAGVTASFNPASITAGQNSVLTLTAPANQPIATVSLSLAASATVEGITTTQSGTVSLSVVAPTTTLLGRTVVADALETPLAGVTVRTLGLDGNGNNTSCTGHTTVSDGAGNFALTNLPMTCTGPQLMSFDGSTATSPAGKYAGVNLVFTLTSGQVTASPVLVHLPRIDTVETFQVAQNSSSNQSYSFKTIPGLSVTVYSGTTFTMPDGSKPNPFPLAAAQVPVDRLPDAKPNVPTMVRDFIVAFQPANATTNLPVAVYFPNTLNTAPGTDMALMTLDPTHGTMVPYGTGAVSADGTQIVPDPDPAHHGHLYGLVHFDWHGPMPPPPPNINPSDNGPCCGDPVDIASGIHIITSTDLLMNSPRFPIAIVRTMRTANGTTGAGPFGIGGEHNFDLRLDSMTVATAATFNLVMPDGRRVPFVRQPDGTLINGVNPAEAGAVIATQANNTATLRWKDGTVYTFQPAPNTSFFGAVLMSIADPNGNIITLTRNPNAGEQIAAITDPSGRQFTLTYDSVGNGRITSIADPIGRTVTYTYNAAGYLATFTDANGGVWRYGYDTSGNLTSVTDPRNVAAEQNAFDANGRVTLQTWPDGSSIGLSYALVNPLVGTSPVMATTVTDQLGRQTVYRFNPQGYLIQVTDPAGQPRVFTLQPGTNLLIGVSGPGSCRFCGNSALGDMSYTYDANGNLLTVQDSLGHTYSYTYDPAYNKTTAVTDPAGNVTRYQYDANGNLTSITGARGNKTSATIGAFGFPATITDAAGQKTTLQYDQAGNLTSFQDPLGNTTTFSYDLVSRRIRLVDPLGAVFSRGWDPLDRLVRATDGLSGSVLATYDAAGNTLSLTNPKGGKTTFTYDQLSRLIMRVDPLGRGETYTYDAVGNLASRTDRRGKVAQFAYDALNRRTSETYADATVATSYDANGRAIQVKDSQSGVFTYQFDSAGELIRSASPVGSVSYTRDAVGRVVTRQAAGGPSVAYRYDAAGNLSQAAAGQIAVNMTFDARNALMSMTRSNGVTSNYTYDALNRLQTIAHVNGGNTLSSFAYTYDPAGRRSSVTANPAQPFVTQAAAGAFDAADEMTALGAHTFTYDANGNRLTDTAGGVTTTYTWDGRNRLQSFASAGGPATQFTYDFAGNLIRQTTGTAATAYVLDQWTNVVEILGGANGAVSLLTGNRVDAHYAAISPSGQAQFALGDALGSVSASTDSSATVSGTDLFEPFGQTTSSGTGFPFAFAGRQPVGGSIYYDRRRYYDALAGRFLSEDPLVFGGGDANLYRYAGNQPVLLTDAFGLQKSEPEGWNSLGESIAQAAAPQGLIEEGAGNVIAQTGATIVELIVGPLVDIDYLFGLGLLRGSPELQNTTVWQMVQRGFNQAYASELSHILPPPCNGPGPPPPPKPPPAEYHTFFQDLQSFFNTAENGLRSGYGGPR